MSRAGLYCLAASLLTALPVAAHDPITTKLTWSKEISRLFTARCMTCHQAGGKSFPLTSYAEARPWAVAIREEVSRRTMPPWNAVRGFGEFRNEAALTQEEISLIVDWVNGGAPDGDPRFLGDQLPIAWTPARTDHLTTVAVPSTLAIARKTTLAGLHVNQMPEGTSARLILERPDGSLEPLGWIRDYRAAFRQPMLFRVPIVAEAGSRVRVIAGTPVELELLVAPSGS